MHWKSCNICGHIFREGYYTEEANSILFSETNRNQTVGHDMENQRIVSSHMIEKIIPYRSSGDWLDIGFGNGSLLFTAQEYGFHPVGVDLREDNVKALNGLGIEAYCQTIETLNFDSRFSVISMADVLEHTPHPSEALKAVYRLLKSDGVIFLSMPNSESMLWRALDLNNINPYWGEIEHYHNFSRSRLYSLLDEYGFAPVRYGIRSDCKNS
jgi:protein O-GlcNAc transferase